MIAKLVRLAVLVAICTGAAPSDGPPSDLVVHEWGTFLAMSGSDGVSLDGMYHEEHALPSFVHSRGRDQLHPQSILIKGETPVIYFYTDKPQSARVEVKFPQGLWTQWYPQAAYVGPGLAGSPTPGSAAPKNGRIIWNVEILPTTGKKPEPPIPSTSADSLWNHAREVDSAFVRTPGMHGSKPSGETERFLFYRGLGTAPLPLRMSAERGGTLKMRSGSLTVRHVFVLRVEGGKGVYSYRPTLSGGQNAEAVIPSLASARPLDEFSAALGADLAARLVECGLMKKEALAMVNTWRSSYFGTDGVRTLFVLPQEWTDEFIPLTITPAPRKIVRVMVGRIELLTPDREQLAASAVRDLASPDPIRRLEGFNTLRSQGRYVEPIVRRVLAESRDEATKTLCRRLLLTDFVTDLRSALDPTVKSKLPGLMTWSEDPLMVRARLAGLLREVGFDDEAKAEGAAVAVELRKQQPAQPDSCYSRFEHTNWALALEGQGDHRAAAGRYGKLIDLAAVALRGKDCRQCHVPRGSVDPNKFADWSIGDAYTQALARSGRLDAELAVQKKLAGAASSDTAATLKVAYMSQAKGQSEVAREIWAKLALHETPKLTAALSTGQRTIAKP
jgi:hypothetical protein